MLPTKREIYRTKQRGRHIWREKIIDAIRNGWGVIPLFGSGMSLQSGIPTGQHLKNYLYYSLVNTLVPRETPDRPVWGDEPSDDQVNAAKRVLGILTAIAIYNVSGNIQPLRIPALADSLAVLEQFLTFETLTRSQTRMLETFLLPFWMRRRLKDSEGPYAKWWADETLALALFYDPPTRVEIDSDSGLGHRGAHLEQASGILALHKFWEEWSSTVVFISRLRHTPERTVYLAQRDPVRIDEFNRHITRFKRPNFAHSLVAHLAEHLRISILLTTNFDTLIEDTFQNWKRPLAVFDVGKAGGLPPTSVVLAQDCVIKLHGSAHDTRADETLNESPSLVELERFASYFGYSRGRRVHRVPKHLLVMGYSGSDLRVVSFIRHLLDTVDDEFRVFWVCHTDTDDQTVQKHFHRECGHKVITCRSNYPDLLLHELHEELTSALPAGGLPFEYIATVPPNPHWGDEPDAERIENVADRILELLGEQSSEETADAASSPTHLRIARLFASPSDPTKGTHFRTPASYWAIEGPTGLGSAARTAFEQLVEKDSICIWLEADDYPDAQAMVAELFRTIAEKTGKWEVANVSLRPDERSLERLVKHYLRINPQKCVLFIWANDVPGSAFGWGTSSWRSPAQFADLHEWLRVLALVGFKVLYFPLTVSTLSHPDLQRVLPQNPLVSAGVGDPPPPSAHWVMDSRFDEARWLPDPIRHNGFAAMLHELFLWFAGSGNQNRAGDDESRHVDHDPHNRVRIANLETVLLDDRFRTIHGWFTAGDDAAQTVLNWPRLQYLFVATLFRQSRHYSVMRTKPLLSAFDPFAVGTDQDEIRQKIVDNWLSRLEELGVVRMKPGGFYWMRWDVRLTIQHWLTGLTFRGEGDDSGRALNGRRAISHGRVAEWYLSAFRATGNITPLVESLFHSSQAVRYADEAELSKARRTSISRRLGPGATPSNYRDVIRAHALKMCINALVVGRSALRLQAQPEFVGRMFGEDGWADFCAATGTDREPGGNSAIDGLQVDLHRLLRIIGADIGESGSRAQSRPLPAIDVVPDYPQLVPGRHAVAGMFQPLAEAERSDASNEMVRRVEDVVNERLIEGAGPECRYVDVNPADFWSMFTEGATFLERELETGRYVGLFDGVIVEKVETAAPHYRTVCMTMDACARLARHFDRRFVLSCWGETLKMQAATGLALSRLGRFREARRRLNEAASYAGFLPPDDMPVAAAAVELRRAEMYYLMGTRTPPEWKPATFEVGAGNYLRLACLDDCWNALGRAEDHLEGRNRSVVWWGRLFLLRMRVALALEQLKVEFSPIQIESIAERGGRSPAAIVEDNFLLSCLLQPKDGMRLLRAIDLKWRFYELRGPSSERSGDKARSGITATPELVEMMTIQEVWQIASPAIRAVPPDIHLRRYSRSLRDRIDRPDSEWLRRRLLTNDDLWGAVKRELDESLG